MEKAGRGQQPPEEEVRGITTRAGEGAEESSGHLERDWRCRGTAEETYCKIKPVTFCYKSSRYMRDTINLWTAYQTLNLYFSGVVEGGTVLTFSLFCLVSELKQYETIVYH